MASNQAFQGDTGKKNSQPRKFSVNTKNSTKTKTNEDSAKSAKVSNSNESGHVPEKGSKVSSSNISLKKDKVKNIHKDELKKLDKKKPLKHSDVVTLPLDIPVEIENKNKQRIKDSDKKEHANVNKIEGPKEVKDLEIKKESLETSRSKKRRFRKKRLLENLGINVTNVASTVINQPITKKRKQKKKLNTVQLSDIHDNLLPENISKELGTSSDSTKSKDSSGIKQGKKGTAKKLKCCTSVVKETENSSDKNQFESKKAKLDKKFPGENLSVLKGVKLSKEVCFRPEGKQQKHPEKELSENKTSLKNLTVKKETSGPGKTDLVNFIAQDSIKGIFQGALLNDACCSEKEVSNFFNTYGTFSERSKTQFAAIEKLLNSSSKDSGDIATPEYLEHTLEELSPVLPFENLINPVSEVTDFPQNNLPVTGSSTSTAISEYFASKDFDKDSIRAKELNLRDSVGNNLAYKGSLCKGPIYTSPNLKNRITNTTNSSQIISSSSNTLSSSIEVSDSGGQLNSSHPVLTDDQVTPSVETENPCNSYLPVCEEQNKQIFDSVRDQSVKKHISESVNNQSTDKQSHEYIKNQTIIARLKNYKCDVPEKNFKDFTHLYFESEEGTATNPICTLTSGDKVDNGTSIKEHYNSIENREKIDLTVSNIRADNIKDCPPQLLEKENQLKSIKKSYTKPLLLEEKNSVHNTPGYQTKNDLIEGSFSVKVGNTEDIICVENSEQKLGNTVLPKLSTEPNKEEKEDIKSLISRASNIVSTDPVPDTLNTPKEVSEKLIMQAPKVKQNEGSKPPKIEKSREEILAEREAKKAAKLAAKNKAKNPTTTGASVKPAENVGSLKKDNSDKQPKVKPDSSPSTQDSGKQIKVEADSSPTKTQDSNKQDEVKVHLSENKEVSDPVIVPKENKVVVTREAQVLKPIKSEALVPKSNEIVVNKPEVKGRAGTGESGDIESKLPTEKSKAELRAERRAKQEAQRAAKAQQQPGKVAQVAPLAAKEKPVKKDLEEVVAAKKLVKVVAGQQLSKPKVLEHRVKLFNHLYDIRKPIAITEDYLFKDLDVHPAIVHLGLQYSGRLLVGSNSRCIALLETLKQIIKDYDTPPEKEFSRGLETEFKYSLVFLDKCRPLSVSMINAFRYLIRQLTQLSNDISDVEAKKKLLESIDTYIRDQIDVAAQAICIMVQRKITNGDVIVIYGCSSLLQRILFEAHDSGTKFRVIVVDGRPWREGHEMLRRLVEHGIECSYVLVTAASFIMGEATKVLLGAHALLANGYVMSRAGASQVALLAHSFNVPVLVCCETHKFCERVQTDSFVCNEIGNPDDLIVRNNPKEQPPLSKWRGIGSLTPLTLNYDVTPPDLVTAVVTELAILPCTSVPVILRIKPSEIG